MQSPRISHLLVLFAVCSFTACEKVPLTSPTGSTITLTLDKTSVPIGGTVQLTAVVSEASGTAPQNGTMVTFNAAFGTITPQEAPTLGGIARATFTGTASGTAKVGAFSGPAKATEVELLVGGAAAASVALRAEPATLPQGGGIATIIAFVRDKAGNPLPNAPINFTTDQGNLSATAAVTDSGGEARVAITTNRDSVVTANVGGTVTGNVTVRIINAPTVAIATTNANPGVGVGVNFTITPGAITNGASIQNVLVNWGDGSGDQSLGAISGATNVTHTFTTAGNFIVTATVSDATGQRSSSTLSVNVQRIAPVVGITPATSSITAGSTVAFSVTAASGTGGPPIQGNITVTQNPGGTVVYSGPSGSFTRTFNAPGTFTLTATATDTAGTTGSASASVTVTNAEGTLTASAPGLACTGTNPTTCTGLAGGTNVNFVATAPTGTTGVSFQWTWGDGTPTEITTARVNSHVYAVAGNYVAQVTITTSTGASSTPFIFLRP